jgi:hypothetical protein
MISNKQWPRFWKSLASFISPQMTSQEGIPPKLSILYFLPKNQQGTNYMSNITHSLPFEVCIAALAIVFSTNFNGGLINDFWVDYS